MKLLLMTLLAVCTCFPQARDTTVTGALKFGDSSRVKIMWNKSATVVTRLAGTKSQPQLYTDVYDSGFSNLSLTGWRVWNRSHLKVMTSVIARGDGGVVIQERRTGDTTGFVNNVARFYNDSTVFYVNGLENLRMVASQSQFSKNVVLQDPNGFIGLSPVLSFKDFSNDAASLYLDGGGLRTTRPLILPALATIPGMPGGSLWWGSGDTLKVKVPSGTIIPVKLTGATDNQVLGWDAGNSMWRPLTQSGGGAGSGKWNALTAPDANLTLNHGANATTFNYSGLINAGLTLQDNATLITPPIPLFQVSIGAASNSLPVSFLSNGNGVELTNAGLFHKVGSGVVEATKYNGNTVIATSDLNSDVALESGANIFLLNQTLSTGKYLVLKDASNAVSMGINNSNASGVLSFWYDLGGGSQSEGARIDATGLHANIFDRISGTGMRFADHIYPDANNSRDIGSTTLRWKDVWLAGAVKAGTWNASPIGAGYITDNISTQKVEVAIGGTLTGTRKRINFIGATAVDNAGSDRVDVTITGSNQMTGKQIQDSLSARKDTMANGWLFKGGISSSSDGGTSEQFGYLASATTSGNAKSTAVGDSAISASTQSLVFGYGATSTSNAASANTIVGGFRAASSASNVVLFGALGTGNAADVVGIGNQVQANAARGVSVGSLSNEAANDGVSIGYGSTVASGKTGGISIGALTNTTGIGAMSFGKSAAAAHDSSIAFGIGSSTDTKHHIDINAIDTMHFKGGIVKTGSRLVDLDMYRDTTVQLPSGVDSVDIGYTGMSSSGWAQATIGDERKPVSPVPVIAICRTDKITIRMDWTDMPNNYIIHVLYRKAKGVGY